MLHKMEEILIKRLKFQNIKPLNSIIQGFYGLFYKISETIALQTFFCAELKVCAQVCAPVYFAAYIEVCVRAYIQACARGDNG